MNQPNARRTVVQMVAAHVAEVRLDVGGANQGKLRLGLVITVATVVVTASGWPPVDAVQKALYLVLVALPCTGVGVGLIVDELMQARADRLGRRRADDREIEALRARIVADVEERFPTSAAEPMRRSSDDVATARQRAPTRPAPAARCRGRLIARGRATAPFRSGFLRLR